MQNQLKLYKQKNVSLPIIIETHFAPLLSIATVLIIIYKIEFNPTYIFHQSMKYVICFSILSFFKMYKKEFCFFFMKGATS